MEHVDTLIAARWVVPIEPAGRVLEEHSIAIRQGRIVAVLPSIEARELFSAQHSLERPHHVMLPGLINAHTHAAMTLLRGAAESASAERWSTDQIAPLEQRWVDAEYVRDGTELAIADMLTSGTTCFADLHLFPEIVAQSAAASGMRACVGLPVMEQPTVWAGSVDEYFDKGWRLHDEYRDDPLITTSLATYSHWDVSDETLLRVRRTADELELPMLMHVNQTALTLADVTGERSLLRLQRLGLLSPLLTAVHMVHIDEADIQLAVNGGINVAHCPQTNLKLGAGVSPAALLLAREVNVALGTGAAAGNNDLSLIDEARSAALLARGLHPQAHATPAHDWLRSATLNAARALGIGDVTGSLVPGKWADLCCIDLNRAHTQPIYDVPTQILYAASRDQVSDVWVAGRALVSDHRLTRLDLADIMQRAQRWQQRISAT